MDILYGLHGGADLDVNMGPILCAEIGIIGYDLAVVEVYGGTVAAWYADRPRP
jgi:hypothetical protein